MVFATVTTVFSSVGDTKTVEQIVTTMVDGLGGDDNPWMSEDSDAFLYIDDTTTPKQLVFDNGNGTVKTVPPLPSFAER